jgi:probable HAF family extracellular repeat protein
MKSRPALICVILLSTAVIVAQAALAVPRYIVLDLGTLPGGTASGGYGINNAGQVTGYSFTTNGPTGFLGDHAFLYSGGSISDLGVLGGAASYGGAASGGYGINNSGEVTGSSGITNGSATHAFLYSDGSMYDLHTLGDPSQEGMLGGPTSHGYGINNSGQVTGDSNISNNSSATHAFLYSAGKMRDLGTLPGGTLSYGYGINNSGQVVGQSAVNSGATIYHAFLYSGSMSDLGTLGGTSSGAYGINGSGQVTGFSGIAGSGAQHAFLYSTNAGMSDLGTLGGSASAGNGINTSGQVVGDSSITGNSANHAFLYSGGAIYDLNNLALNGQLADFSSLLIAKGINDYGWIVGSGVTTNGVTHAFLAIPIQILTLTHLANGDFRLLCQGVPNVANRIEASPDLTPNSFSTLDSITADATGAFQYDDVKPAMERFFRIAYP